MQPLLWDKSLLFFTIIAMKNSILNCKVNQFYSKNQFIIELNDCIIFQSYNSICCIIDNTNKVIQFWIDFDYSKTTMKYLSKFLIDNLWLNSCNIQYIRKSIKDWFLNNWYIEYKVLYNENLI
jgi:hypothetical protein